jgi:glycerol-3-phosphate O-acyltransferase 3/4
MLQYGRQNIESVKKRNGSRDPDEDSSGEKECESPAIMEKDVTVISPKTQNGCVGNSVIARSKDLILVPEPEAQNHKNHIDESKPKNNHKTSTIDDKEVNL